jgi:SH3-like domain-containing protein
LFFAAFSNAMPLPIRTSKVRRMRLFSVAFFSVCWLALGAYYMRTGAQVESGEVTGSLNSAPDAVSQKGPSGLPLPRFVSLKSEKVNVRKGPSSDHPVAWVFTRKGLPVEIIAEFENWRKIRDSEGAEGWILQQMLSGKRSAIVMAYDGKETAPMYTVRQVTPSPVAQLTKGVTGFVSDCDGAWCAFSAENLEGYVQQVKLWGVYPDELVN